MNPLFHKSTILIFILLACPLFLLAHGGKTSPAPNNQVGFTENKGQWPSQIFYKAELPSGGLYLEKNSVVYSFYDPTPLAEYSRLQHQKGFDKHGDQRSFILKGHSYRVRFLEADAQSYCETSTAKAFYYNYFIGNNPAHWASGVKTYETVNYRNVYPNTDIKFYSLGLGIKYDVILQPGADLNKVQLQIAGAEHVWLEYGKLYIKTSVNTTVEQEPYAYQLIEGAQVQVPCRFRLQNNILGFEISGTYNKNIPLIIDPLLIFSTYSGSTADNWGKTATYDAYGNFYAGGTVSHRHGGVYPVDTGSYQKTFGGGTGNGHPCDISISKYTSKGDSLLFATYLGGSFNDYPHSIVVDNNNELVLMGTSSSPDFPVKANGYDTSQNGQADLIVCKFSENGRLLLASTFVGGSRNDGLNSSSLPLYKNYSDDLRGDIVFDDENNYYIASSSSSSDFPISGKALQTTYAGNQDAVLFKLNSNLSQLLWSSYYGGTGTDAFYSIRLNRAEELFVAGGTNSTNFRTTPNAAVGSYQGGAADGVIVHLTNTGDSLLAASYVGTAAYDQVYFIDVDRKSNVYLMGQTEGAFPIIPSTIYNVAGSGQFLMKIDKQISSIHFSTVFGSGQSGPDISPSAFLVDNCENLYISGWGGSINTGRNTSLLPVSTDAIQSNTDGQDFYLAVFGKNVNSLLYATYFGGNLTGDHVDGGTSRFDKKGVVYQSVCASCPEQTGTINDFPTTANSAFPTNVSIRCSNASFKLDLQIANSIEASFKPNPSKGCVPLSVSFQNKSIGGLKQLWDFGDGNTDTSYSPTHVFTKSGVFTVKLILFDSLSCTIADTIEKTVTVLPGSKADFNYEYDQCNEEFRFYNSSTNALSNFWDFGDGNKDSLEVNPRHTYAQPGKYTVKLLVNKGYACADSISKVLDLNADSLRKVNIPNVFTPNSDGFNDSWYIGGIDSLCDQAKVWIYNRWGQLMFKNSKTGERWYGESQNTGFEAPSGVYFYIVEITRKNGEQIKRHGNITLIRN